MIKLLIAMLCENLQGMLKVTAVCISRIFLLYIHIELAFSKGAIDITIRTYFPEARINLQVTCRKTSYGIHCHLIETKEVECSRCINYYWGLLFVILKTKTKTRKQQHKPVKNGKTTD